jgi:hypothetical protein
MWRSNLMEAPVHSGVVAADVAADEEVVTSIKRATDTLTKPTSNRESLVATPPSSNLRVVLPLQELHP